MEVRAETPEDATAVRLVHERAFASLAEPALVEALRRSDAHVPELCLVALEAGEVVAHIAFSRARLGSGHDVLALAPMGVLPELQGRGYGTALVTEALRRAAETAYGLVVVVGHAGYYPRFGFEPARPLGIIAPFPVPDEAWMVHALPRYEPRMRGTLTYADAFADVT